MSSTDKYILAIDLGTSGPKVALFSTQGELIGSEFEETKVMLFPDGGANNHQMIGGMRSKQRANACSPKVWFPTMILSQLPPPLNGLALSQWIRMAMQSGNAIIWMDSRGAPYIHKMVDGFPKVEGYALPKLINWIRLTGGAPSNAGKDPIAHILYLKDVHPDIYQRTYKFLEPIDYIGLRLTGKFAASFNSIILHWVTDNRDIENVTYHEGLAQTRRC